jgi:succinate dehydrogenase / fumarate reductase flavoprotein subunit
MSESLRNDGRVWVPALAEDAKAVREGRLKASDIPEERRDYYLERKYPAFGNLVPRDVASRAAKEVCDAGHGVAPTGLAVFLDFEDSIRRLGKSTISARYGNLFEMYEKITGDNPYETPMKIYPAVHYTMGGLWVDYELMTTVPGLYAIGEANFSDHGANRLGASALMQGLADGYFVLPYTIGSYLSGEIRQSAPSTEHPAFAEAETKALAYQQKILDIQGRRSPESFHRELGKIMWEYCGMARSREGLTHALGLLDQLHQDFWSDVRVGGKRESFNPELDKAQRVADFIELGRLMVCDALAREESCGGHFRVEHQTPEGEALRHDDTFAYVSAWEYTGPLKEPIMHREDLVFEAAHPTQRSYK